MRSGWRAQRRRPHNLAPGFRFVAQKLWGLARYHQEFENKRFLYCGLSGLSPPLLSAPPAVESSIDRRSHLFIWAM